MRFVTLLSLSLSLLLAQGTTSRVVGTVQDPTGSAVAGAKVRLINESTGLTFETQTAEAGNYQFESVQIGLYTLEVESAGFKKFVTRNNQLTVGTPMTVKVSMVLGALADSVEVSSAAELVQTSQSGNLGPVINERTMKRCPLWPRAAATPPVF